MLLCPFLQYKSKRPIVILHPFDDLQISGCFLLPSLHMRKRMGVIVRFASNVCYFNAIVTYALAYVTKSSSCQLLTCIISDPMASGGPQLCACWLSPACWLSHESRGVQRDPNPNNLTQTIENRPRLLDNQSMVGSDWILKIKPTWIGRLADSVGGNWITDRSKWPVRRPKKPDLNCTRHAGWLVQLTFSSLGLFSTS